MNANWTRSPKPLRLAPLSLLGLVVASTTSYGCLTRPIEGLDSRTTWTAQFRHVRSGVDKIDLVLMIDNSASMADKQSILADAVPELVKGLLNPPCIGADDKPLAEQPASPADACPPGAAREFDPVLDVHIGIVSSSIGSHGYKSCVPDPAVPGSQSVDDRGHLVSRIDAATPDQKVPTYGDKGFLVWDPAQTQSPPGGKDLEGTVESLRTMVKGVGQVGCGYEAQLESWYRFLVDPEPYASISIGAKGEAVRSGTDEELLAERAAFLRPDSLVAILMLTDENDCSTIEESGYPLMVDTTRRMPRARQECATNLADPCCKPCGQALAECPEDPTCKTSPSLTEAEDPINLRCFDQKRRFGADFLYGTHRYVEALTQPKVQKHDKSLADNPLFPPDPDGKLRARTPEAGLVFLAGIVGVPWQDIARRRDGKPDLVQGLDRDGKPVGGFMSAYELGFRDPETNVAPWDVILGDPATGKAPLDPLMIESRDPRTNGENPVTHEPPAPPDSSSATANSINGHEWNTNNVKTAGGQIYGELQYACIFDLKAEDARDCSQGGSCDCEDVLTSDTKNPLCQDKVTGEYSTVQRRAKAYPGVRQLQVLKGLGEQGIVASACPAQVTDPKARDYGYTPAIGAIIDKLKHKLSGQCLGRPLSPNGEGQVSCIVIEASKSEGGACCAGTARKAQDAKNKAAIDLAKADRSTAGADCFCEIAQLAGDEVKACQTDESVVPVSSSGGPLDGWCYVDESTGPTSLVDGCAAGEKYKMRFVGKGHPGPEAMTFITCAGGL